MIGSTPNEVYHDMIVRCGYVRMVEGRTRIISLHSKIDLSRNTDDFLHYTHCIYTAYMGREFVGGNEFKHHCPIRGSSAYNKAEMARFIDRVVCAAKDIDIETLTSDQLESMKYKKMMR